MPTLYTKCREMVKAMGNTCDRPPGRVESEDKMRMEMEYRWFRFRRLSKLYGIGIVDGRVANSTAIVVFIDVKARTDCSDVR